MSLEIEGVTIRLGGREILQDVSLTARPGELVCLLGPNGAGKTTLVRATCALVAHEGRISFAGNALAMLTPRVRARMVAYLPQGHVAHWPITAREVVAIGRAPHASSLNRLSAEDEAAVERALAATDAEALAERPVTELSGGERARVMLARALAVEAPLLLADEPTASLDPAHQLAVLDVLRQTADRGGLVIAALHDLALAARFGTRVIVLNGRRIAADGPPEEALTPELLREVFAIRALELRHGASKVIVPWSVEPSSPG
jgi:iron complex transport system ATP-binding protein